MVERTPEQYGFLSQSSTGAPIWFKLRSGIVIVFDCFPQVFWQRPRRPLPCRAEAEIHHEEASSGARVGVGCHQIVQPEQSHECPPPRAVREPPAPVQGIPYVGG